VVGDVEEPARTQAETVQRLEKAERA
jgi:hypothetical protein